MRRQIGPAARPETAFAAPAFQRFINRLNARLLGRIGGQIVNRLAVQHIAGANLNLVKAVQHIELGQRNAVNARRLDHLAHQHRIKPATAPLAPRHRAEFMAAFAQLLPDFIILLGRERPLAHPRGVGFGDAQHMIERGRAKPAAGRRLSGNGVGGGDKRICAVVNIKQHALRALKQNALTGAARLDPAIATPAPYRG